MAGTNDPRTAMADLILFTGDVVIVEVGPLPPTATKPGTAILAAKEPHRSRLHLVGNPPVAVHRKILMKSSKWLYPHVHPTRKTLLIRDDRKDLLANPLVKRVLLDSECMSQQMFNYYTNWLYFGTFATKRPQPSGEAKYGTHDDLEYLDLAQSWSACCWLEDQEAADDAINAFVAKMKGSPSLPLPGRSCISWVFCVEHAYQGALGRLIATAYAAEASAEQLANIFECTSSVFQSAVLSELAQLRIENRQKIASMNSCSFHAHAANEPCESNEKARKRRRLG